MDRVCHFEIPYSNMDQVGSSPVIVMEVDSGEQRVKDVEAAGGLVVVAPHQVGQFGIYSQVKDTKDNVIGVWQSLHKSQQQPGRRAASVFKPHNPLIRSSACINTQYQSPTSEARIPSSQRLWSRSSCASAAATASCFLSADASSSLKNQNRLARIASRVVGVRRVSQTDRFGHDVVSKRFGEQPHRRRPLAVRSVKRRFGIRHRRTVSHRQTSRNRRRRCR